MTFLKMSPSAAMIIVLPTMLSLQSPSWFSLWIMMEISAVSMCVLMLKEKWKEKILMFFLFQMMSSAFLLFYLFISTPSFKLMETPSKNLLILGAIMIKMALFPMHLWVVSLSKILNWFTLFIMSTWQKMIPVVFLMKMDKNSWLTPVSITSMLIMNVMLLSSSLLKCFMAISSSVHSSWMMISSLTFKALALMYLLLYSTVSALIFSLLSKDKSKSISTSKNSSVLSNFKVNMMSMAGTPPLLGFLMKVVVVVWMAKMLTMKALILMVMMMALLSMYSYYQLIIKSMFIKENSIKQKSSEKVKSKISLVVNSLATMVVLLL